MLDYPACAPCKNLLGMEISAACVLWGRAKGVCMRLYPSRISQIRILCGEEACRGLIQTTETPNAKRKLNKQTKNCQYQLQKQL